MSTTQLGSARVELEVAIEAPREKVWQGLVEEIGEWWPREFFTTESPRFTLDPHVGGYMYENTGDGTGAVWFQVLAFLPPEKLHLTGHIAPPYGGPATSLVQISLESQGDSTTLFRLTDCLFGVLPEDSCMDEGWRQIFEKNFKTFIEAR